MNTATIRVVCTSCGSKLDIRSELAGSKRRCPKCKSEFVVPAVEDDGDGISPGEESETVAETTSKTPPPLSESDDSLFPDSNPGAAAPPAAKDNADDDDEDDEDYIPSFVTAAVKDDAKTPLPPTPSKVASKSEDDQEILSIPNLPPPTKPKFKSFDVDEFADAPDESQTPVPAARSATTPSSTRDRNSRRSQLSDEFDIDNPSPPPKSRGSSRSASLSDASMPTPSPTRDRAAAARELRQALKDSSLREAPEQPTRGFNIDLAGLGSELGLKGLAIILGIVLLCPILYFAVTSMVSGKGLKLPPLGYVTGTVTFNGQPAVNAIVKFMPVPSPGDDSNTTNFNKIRTSYGVTNERGEYKLLYIEGVPGVAIGNCRVWIELQPPLVAPGEFSPAGSTMREIKPGSQTFDFSMTAQVPQS